MTWVIRHRLLYILTLGVLVSALSLTALLRALQVSEAQRLERSRDALSAELDALVTATPTMNAPAATSYTGMRAGWVLFPDDTTQIADLPAAWVAPLRAAVAESRAARDRGAAARIVSTTPVPPSTLIIAVAPAGQRYAWAGVLMAPSSFLRPWRLIASGIAIATALLVATSLAGLFSFRRQTRALEGALEALGRDLRAPVPRPDLAELAGLGEGIERLAHQLLSSREATDRLSRELAVKERLAALGRVAAGVAHEVRNPLAAIKLRLDLSAASTEVPATTRTALASASSEIARLDRLVTDLLIVAGQKPGVRKPVDLGELLRARAEQLAPWAEQRGVSLLTEGSAEAEADPESLARAIDNLLRNAVEASPSGEAVRARVGSRDDVVELDVEDRGAGVQPARAAELFEPFFTTKPEGTGLGLALSRAIARTHGGEVIYRRDDGRTCFRMSLQRSSEAHA